MLFNLGICNSKAYFRNIHFSYTFCHILFDGTLTETRSILIVSFMGDCCARNTPCYLIHNECRMNEFKNTNLHHKVSCHFITDRHCTLLTITLVIKSIQCISAAFVSADCSLLNLFPFRWFDCKDKIPNLRPVVRQPPISHVHHTSAWFFVEYLSRNIISANFTPWPSES